FAELLRLGWSFCRAPPIFRLPEFIDKTLGQDKQALLCAELSQLLKFRTKKGKSMHGLIFAELKKYVVAKFDEKTWETLLEKAGLKGNMYLASSVYADADILALVNTACQMTGLSASAVMEDFGEFIAPDLVTQYKFLVKPDWTLLDFLSNTEDTIHKVVRFHS